MCPMRKLAPQCQTVRLFIGETCTVYMISAQMEVTLACEIRLQFLRPNSIQLGSLMLCLCCRALGVPESDCWNCADQLAERHRRSGHRLCGALFENCGATLHLHDSCHSPG